MTSPTENLPAKPLFFEMQDRRSKRAKWCYPWRLLAASSADAVTAACNLLQEKSENVRVVGIAFPASEIVPREKSAGE